MDYRLDRLDKLDDHFYPHDKCDNFLCQHFLIGENSNLIKFDPFWTVPIRSDQKYNDNFFRHGNCDNFLRQHFLIAKNSNLIKFDPF